MRSTKCPRKLESRRKAYLKRNGSDLSKPTKRMKFFLPPAPESILDLPLEILFKIFAYLDTSDLFLCREVSRKFKVAADEIMDKNVSFPLMDKYSDFFKADNAFYGSKLYIEFLRDNVKGTWFLRTDDMKDFLFEMENASGNPFPFRTIILCLADDEEPSTNGLPLSQHNSKRRLKDVDILKLFILKFGKYIQNCFLVVRDDKEGETGRLDLEIFKLVLGMKNLVRLGMYCHNWDDQFKDFLNEAIDNSIALPHLEKLKDLEIFGYGGDSPLLSFFSEAGYSKQIEKLCFQVPDEEPIIETYIKILSNFKNLQSLLVCGEEHCFNLSQGESPLSVLNFSVLQKSFFLEFFRLFDSWILDTVQKINVDFIVDIPSDLNVPKVEIKNAKIYCRVKEFTVNSKILNCNSFPSFFRFLGWKFPKLEKLSFDEKRSAYTEFWNSMPSTLRTISIFGKALDTTRRN